jgi:hypothetical protein
MLYTHLSSGEDVHAIQLVEALYFGGFEHKVPGGYWLVVHQDSGYQQWFSDTQFQSSYALKPLRAKVKPVFA